MSRPHPFATPGGLRAVRPKQPTPPPPEPLPALPSTAGLLDSLCQWTALHSVSGEGGWQNAAGDVWHVLNAWRDRLEARTTDAT